MQKTFPDTPVERSPPPAGAHFGGRRAYFCHFQGQRGLSAAASVLIISQIHHVGAQTHKGDNAEDQRHKKHGFLAAVILPAGKLLYLILCAVLFLSVRLVLHCRRSSGRRGGLRRLHHGDSEAGALAAIADGDSLAAGAAEAFRRTGEAAADYLDTVPVRYFKNKAGDIQRLSHAVSFFSVSATLTLKVVVWP